MFLVDTSIAHTKFHEKVFQLDFCRVIEACNTHCVDPEGESLIQVLGLCETVV